jgi:hypothetical protein
VHAAGEFDMIIAAFEDVTERNASKGTFSGARSISRR